MQLKKIRQEFSLYYRTAIMIFSQAVRLLMEQYVIVKRKQFNRSKIEYIFGFDSEAFNGMAGFNQLN